MALLGNIVEELIASPSASSTSRDAMTCHRQAMHCGYDPCGLVKSIYWVPQRPAMISRMSPLQSLACDYRRCSPPAGS